MRAMIAQADVVANWDAIVGSDLAAVSAPERIVRPRGTGEEAQKQGGTLVIRAAPGRALELQGEASRIIAAINSFFGHGAVAQLKVMQAVELERPGAPGPPR
ncbi:MAG: DciA family protein [Hyphomicrobiales bacterium]